MNLVVPRGVPQAAYPRRRACTLAHRHTPAVITVVMPDTAVLPVSYSTSVSALTDTLKRLQPRPQRLYIWLHGGAMYVSNMPVRSALSYTSRLVQTAQRQQQTSSCSTGCLSCTVLWLPSTPVGTSSHCFPSQAGRQVGGWEAARVQVTSRCQPAWHVTSNHATALVG